MRREAAADAAERTVYRGLAVLLVAVPLPFGGERPWAWSLCAAAVGAGLTVWGVAVAGDESRRPLSLRPIWPCVALFSAAALWAAAQSVAPVPETWRHPLWQEAGSALGATVPARISLDPFATGTALMRLLTYGGVFLLAYQLCTAAARAERLIRVLTGAAAAYACYGLAVELGGWNSVLWYPKTGDMGHLSSTFPSRNAFATYAGLATLCALALMFRPVIRRGDLEAGWRFSVTAVVGHLFARIWTLIAAASILFTAVLATHSRAGMAATVVGLAVLLAILTWRKKGRRGVVVAVSAIAIGGVGLFVAFGGATVGRLTHVAEAADERVVIYGRTVEAVEQAPLLGTGFGTFGSVFPMYRGESLPAPFRRAHNSYLENALELGVPAAAAVVLALAWVAVRCARALRRRRRDAYYPALALAALALAGVHAAFDYSLQVPTVSTTLAAILGAACAQSVRLDRRRAGRREAPNG